MTLILIFLWLLSVAFLGLDLLFYVKAGKEGVETGNAIWASLPGSGFYYYLKGERK